MGLGRIQSTTNYEDLRNARILENQNRLKTLGLQKTMSELRSLVSQQKSPKSTPVRRWTKRVYDTSSLRRSDRLKNIPISREATSLSSTRRSHRLRAKLFEPISGLDNGDTVDEGSPGIVGETSVRPANMPLVKIKGSEARLSPEASARRCGRTGRGSVYDSVFGICCHFCSSFCLKRRKISPTGIAIYRAQALGYKSVAHLLMDELQGAFKRERC